MCNLKLLHPLFFLLSIGITPIVSAGTFEVENWQEIKKLKRTIRATQFLNRATFGATQAEIETLADRMMEIGERQAAEEWIDHQFSLPATSHVDTALAMVAAEGFTPTQSGINVGRYRSQAWWHVAIAAPDQLRQRIAWAMSQIYVVNDRIASANNQSLDASGNPRWLGNSGYYDMLVRNASTSYRQTIDDVTFSPIMGVFLSHLRNRKANPDANSFPDENYAREIQQLFSIGLYELRLNGKQRRRRGELIPTYDNETIKAFSRVFTGFNYAGSTTPYNGGRNYNEPMVLYDAVHDTEEKTLLRDVVLPAGQTAAQDISDGLDNIANHPNVGPFISRLLIQRLVKSNPSKGYIKRVARAFNGTNSTDRGDMVAVIKAILLDREAWRSIRFKRLRNPNRLQVITRGTEYSKLKEPVFRYAHFVRAFNGAVSEYPGNYYALPNLLFVWSQAAHKSPSVFNFYSPYHQPAGAITNYEPHRRIPNGAIYAPEFELMTGVTGNRTANRFRSDVVDENAYYRLLNNSNGLVELRLTFDFEEEKALATDPAALVEHLDLLLCEGTMSDEARQIIAEALAEETEDATVRARSAILAVLTSPDYVISD